MIIIGRRSGQLIMISNPYVNSIIHFCICVHRPIIKTDTTDVSLKTSPTVNLLLKPFDNSFVYCKLCNVLI